MIVVDATNVCYMIHHAMGEELSENDILTGVTFGFLNYVLSLATHLKENNLCFCFDSRKNFRKLYYSYYKGKRDNRADFMECFGGVNTRTHMYRQMDELRKEILPELGFRNVFMLTGLEADDLIAKLVDQYAATDNITIVSADEDLYQCLRKNVRMYKPRAKKIYTITQFKKDYGITPDKWPEVKALAGCSSDNLKGVHGIGEKTAIKFIKNELKPSTKAYKNIKVGWHIYKFTLPMVMLPWKQDGKDFSLNTQPNEFEREAFIEVFDRLRFVYHLKQEQFVKWEKHFNL